MFMFQKDLKATNTKKIKDNQANQSMNLQEIVLNSCFSFTHQGGCAQKVPPKQQNHEAVNLLDKL